MGSERDNNFLLFANGSNRADYGFISSLVQNHNNEKNDFNRIQRALSKSRSTRGSSSRVPVLVERYRVRNHRVHKYGSAKKLSAKKASKSKF